MRSRSVEVLEPRQMLSVDVNGWTILQPSSDSRVIYVDNTPGGPGNDNNTGQSTSSPVFSVNKALSLVRSGFPDWVLLKRGDTFNQAITSFAKSGRSENEPFIISSYGTGARPRFVTGASAQGFSTASTGANNFVLRGLEFTPGVADTTSISRAGFYSLGNVSNVLIEDCVFTRYQTNFTLQTNNGPLTNFKLRRSIVADAYAANSSVVGQEVNNRSQGMYAQGVNGLLLEQNVFDHNGWNASVSGAGPNMYSQNIYLQSDTSNVTVQGNIIAEASGHGLQARSGGIVKDNLFLSNAFGMSFGYVKGAAVTNGGVAGEVANNVFIGSRDVPWDPGEWAMDLGNIRAGTNTTVHDNVIHGDTTGTRPAVYLRVDGNEDYNPQQDVGINDLTFQHNTVYDWTYGLETDPLLVPGTTGRTGLNDVTFKDNEFQRMDFTPVVAHEGPFASSEETWSGGVYDTSSSQSSLFAIGSTQMTLNDRRAQVEPTAQQQQIQYVDPNRTAATYNAAIGGTGTLAAFLTGARGQSMTNWQSAYTAPAVNNYVRAGFVRADATTTTTLAAAADAYVRDGTYATQNFGATTDLNVKKHAAVGYSRETYLRFDLSNLGQIEAATLRLFGKSTSSTQNVNVGLYAAGNTTWAETALNWNNRPAGAGTPMATKTITGTVTGAWYTFDVTPYLQQQKAAGATAVTFALKGLSQTDQVAVFNSDENSANKPQLVVQQAVSQALVVSTGNVTVPEGDTANFSVKLAVQPAGNVTVNVARTSGDTDVSVQSGSSLVFTPTNWNTAQTVVLAAAEDADAANGSAVFTVSSTALTSKTVTASEADNDVTNQPVTVRAAADAYVRDGSYATTNFGGVTELTMKNHTAAGYTRESYLRFSLSDASSVGSAVLRLYGGLQQAVTGGLVNQVYGVSDVSWSESALNWNNRPAASTGVLATLNVVGTAKQWYEINLTSYVQQQKAAGATAVTLLFRNAVVNDAVTSFASDEAAASQPQLVLTPGGAQVPQIVTSLSDVTVGEGATAPFTVRLSSPPTVNTTVNVARTSGDTDLAVQSGSSLVFTPSNWNTPQTVTLAAAQDADSVNGAAVFTVSSTGLASTTVAATESDDDPVVGPITIRAAADATVRDGANAATNFGTTADLTIKKNASVGYTRESYLRFSLTGVSSVGSATLRLYGNLQETNAGGLNLQVYGVDNVSWSETGINWNNRPAVSTGMLATKNVPDTTKRWYEIDLTSYLQQRKAAGATAVTLLLRNATNSNAVTTFASDEASANQPQLVITPAVAGPVGVVVDTQSLAVPEGFSSSFDVRLASAPASNVTVTIAKQSGGDTDLNVNKTSLTFTPANWNVNQSVTVNATDDNTDTISGSALFVVTPTAGGTPFTVVASEIENDGKGGANVLAPVDDAYVRDGTYADTNFGGTNDIIVKRSSGPGYTREGYLTFDLSNEDAIVGGRLRLYGRLTATTNASLVTQVFPATAGTNWSQSTLTWNTRPAAGTWPLGSITVTGTTARWYEIDVTSYLQAEKAAGRNRVTFVLRNSTDSDAMTSFASFETQGNWPELVVVRNYPSDTDTRLMRAIDVADQQLRSTLSQLGTDATKYVYVTQGDGNWTVVNADTWTSGMLPASLWYMARETGDAYWTTEAIRRTLPLEGQKTQKDDLAFRLAYAYWPLYAATNNAAYRQVLIDAAASKVATYNGAVHAFLSPGRASTSGDPNANFGVLTDQITDVELVLWAAQQTNNSDWYDKAIDHLHTMAQYSVRPDGSTYQWIYFNSKTGAFVGGEGYQGYSATSTWSRGQAWAIYGFTAAYRLTGQPELLTAAKKVTDWYLNHLPAGDMVPYWDFNDPAIPNTFKDSSAAAVAADGMAQLATLDSNPTDAAKYRKAAGDTLTELASPAYLNENVAGGGGSRGILLHGAWFVPDPIDNGDASVIWGDYFFLEAINKYMGSKTAP
jgi:unsaturated chondroitin disaccharide hydrolase